MKQYLVLALFIFFHIFLSAEIKALWVPAWDLADSTSIDEVVQNAKKCDINELLVEIRFRGDCLYKPNKFSNKYFNPEKPNHILKDSLFDPFQYIMDKAHKEGIKVQAWVTTFLATPHQTSYLDSNHVYFAHPEWLTYDMYHKPMAPKVLEGAYIDPGLPRVQNYLLDIFSDIIINYKPDGFHLDYIRYPGYIYGYNPFSWRLFILKNKIPDGEKWLKWRQKNITDFIKKLKSRIKQISPRTILTAAVIWKLEAAREKYGQDWFSWIKKGYLDRIYLMAYTKSNEDFCTYMDTVSTLKMNKKIVIGLRAWDKENSYPAQDISYKINFIRKDKFMGFSLFSSTGMKKNNFWKPLKRTLQKK